MQNLTRRRFARISITVAAGTVGLVLSVTDLRADGAKGEKQTVATPPDARAGSRPAVGHKLQSEFLSDLNLEAETPQNLGSAGRGRLIVPVAGGTFAGHGLKCSMHAAGADRSGQRLVGAG